MQSNTEYTEQLNIYVQQTLSNRIRPIELLLCPIYDCYQGEALAYRAVVRVNSIIAGVIDQDVYLNGNVDESLMAEFTLLSIKKAMQAGKALKSAERRFSRIFVRCPLPFVFGEDIYASLSALNEGDGRSDTGICLEFDREIMEMGTERLIAAFSDIRSAGFAVAVSGYGGQGFAIEKLLSACPDYVFLDGSVTELVLNREKRSALPPLINLVRGLGGEVIACEVSSDDELREFRSRDCFGFLPSDSYKGALPVESRKKQIIEIINTEA